MFATFLIEYCVSREKYDISLFKLILLICNALTFRGVCLASMFAKAYFIECNIKYQNDTNVCMRMKIKILMLQALSVKGHNMLRKHAVDRGASPRCHVLKNTLKNLPAT